MSLVSWYTLQWNNPVVVDTPIEVVENVQTDYPQKKSKPKIENKSEVVEDIDEKNDVEKVDELDLLIENDDIDEDIDNDGIDTGESLKNENREEILDSYDENDDEYEEIIFQDDFDKEYWSGTDDNYLEN
jgi:hypothetical protein